MVIVRRGRLRREATRMKEYIYIYIYISVKRECREREREKQAEKNGEEKDRKRYTKQEHRWRKSYRGEVEKERGRN